MKKSQQTLEEATTMWPNGHFAQYDDVINNIIEGNIEEKGRRRKINIIPKIIKEYR